MTIENQLIHMKISQISVDRPTVVVVVFSILTVLGITAYHSLNHELLPKFSAPVITVTSVYPGASPSEVENAVTRPLEEAVSSLENVISMKSTSMEGFSVITLELTLSADIDQIVQDAQRKVNTVTGELPVEVKTPTVNTFAVDEMPIMRIGVSSALPPTVFYDLVRDQVVPALARIEGAAEISLLGGQEREIQVKVRRRDLEAHAISILQVVDAIQQANLDFPTGKVENEEQQVLIRLSGKFEDLTQLRELMITAKPSRGFVALREVADVVDTYKEEEVIVRVDGQDATGLLVKKQTDANAVAVSRLVRKTLKELEIRFAGEGLSFNVAQDTSLFTLEAVEAVQQDLINAVILVAMVMLLFLHSLRNAFFVMITVPVSLIATFIAMQVFGFTLNLMTLLSLSLVVGILVDDSIIVLENIYRHLEMGKKRLHAVMDAVREIGITVISTTAVLVIVFLPLALADSIVTLLLRQFSLVIVVATILSSFVALMIIPTLASRFAVVSRLREGTWIGKLVHGFEAMIDSLSDRLINMLTWSFRRPWVVFLCSVLAFVFSVALIPAGFIGSEFAGTGDRGEFIIEVEFPKDATLRENNRITRQIEQMLSDLPEVTSVFTTVGITSNIMSSQSTHYLTELNVRLVPGEEREFTTNVFARLVKNELEALIPGVKITSVPVSIIGTADDAPIMLVVSAPTTEDALAYGDRLLEVIREVPGTIEQKMSVEGGNPEISVAVDREKMKKSGLNMAMVGATMQTAFNGNDDAKFRDGDREYDIQIRLDEFDRRNTSDIELLTLTNSSGLQIRLSEFARVNRTTGPSKLERKDRIASVSIQSQVIGRPAGTVGDEIRAKVAEIELPGNVTVTYEGDMKNQDDAFGSMGTAFIVSVFFVYLIMVALYNSYLHPLVVLFSIPLAIIGALWALALANQSLSIFSFLGIIMLVGLVTKNAILVVDFTNELRGKGYGTAHALLTASRLRLRPILMTALSMIIALFPIALSQGPGAAWKNALAWALIGGMSSSLLLSLIVVPVVYLSMENFKLFFRTKINGFFSEKIKMHLHE